MRLTAKPLPLSQPKQWTSFGQALLIFHSISDTLVARGTSMAFTLPKSILVLSAGWAVYALWIISSQNGLFKQMGQLSAPGSVYPFTETPVRVRQVYTRTPLDPILSGTATMFMTGASGSRPDLSLILLELLCQITAAWTLFSIEAQRNGNSSQWILTAITTLGLVMQSAGFAIVIPLYLYLHLRNSPTVKASTAGPLTVPNPLHLLTLPINISISILLPVVLMALPPPQYLSPDHSTQQLYMAYVYFYPLTLLVLQTALPAVLSVLTGTLNTQSESERTARSLSYLRWCYIFALLVAGSAHVVYLGIPCLAWAFPAIFNTKYLQYLQPGTVFLPIVPSANPLSLADGVSEFLKWEIIAGLYPVLVWAVTLRASARELWAIEWVGGLFKTLALVLLVGPAGAAVALVWERDEMVFEWTLQKQK